MSDDPTKPKPKKVKPKFDLDAALDQSIGGNGHATNGVQVQPTQQKTNGFDLDAALDQSLSPQPIKKKENGSESPTYSQAPISKSETQLPLQGGDGKVSIFDNPTLNPSLQKNVITTADGGEIPITRATPLGTDGLQDLQDRVIKKTASPDDIEALANASGKSTQAIQAHILQGTKAGALVENNDNVQKTKTQLENYINTYNKINGTTYDPKDILSSSQKTFDFLQRAKTEQINKPISDVNYATTSSTRVPSNLRALTTPLPSDISNDMINQVVQKTIDEDKTAGIPKDKTIVKIAERINPVDFKRSQQALNEKSGLLSAFDFYKDTQGQNELLNYQKGIAELKYNEGLKQNALNKMSLGYINGDKTLMEAGQQDLSEVDDNVADRYSILQKQEIVRRVNETIARESGVVEGSDTEPGHRLERAFGADVGDRARVMQDLGYFDNPKTKDAALSLLANPQLFADNSILGSVASSFAEPFKNLGMSIGDITGLRTNKDIIADHLKDELFSKDFSQNNPDDPNVPHLKTDVRISRNIVNTTANLAGMLAIATATEGIGTEAGLSINAAKQLGAYTSFGLPAFDASLKDSKNFIDSEPAQYLYAAINSIANAEGGRLLDLGKITRIPGVSEDFAKVANKLTDKSVAEDAIRETLDKGKNKYVDFAVKYGKNVTNGAATMAYFNIANNVVKMAFGDPNTTTDKAVTQAGNAFLDGVLGMSIMGGFGAAADMRNEKNTSFKGTIYNMAVNHDSAKDVFDLGLKNGQYTKAEYDQKVQILNTAVAAKNALDVTEQQTGTELSQDQKSVYVANKTAQGVLRKLADQPGINEKTANGYEGQIKKLAEQSQQVMDGLKFTSTLEPLYNLFDAEKEYNAAKENYNPADKKSDDALLAAKDKYDKLYSDYLKDIPDNSSQSKTIQNGQSKKENAQEAQSAEENGQQIGVLKEKGAEVETAPSIEDLKKIQFDVFDDKTGEKQKYKDIELDDPVTGKTETLTAQKAKIKLENRHDVLSGLIKCLTLTG